MTTHKDDGGPAFPFATIDGHLCLGMTLRDYFAAKAMQGLLAGQEGSYLFIQRDDGVTEKHPARKIIPALAYQYADEMLKVKEQS